MIARATSSTRLERPRPIPDPHSGGAARPLLEDGHLATCAIVDLEVLYSSRNLADYEEILEERRSLDTAPTTAEVMAKAIDLQHQLARRGQHRVPIPDLIISAAALLAGLVVLHYDADFERITAVGGAPQDWVLPREGSVATRLDPAFPGTSAGVSPTELG